MHIPTNIACRDRGTEIDDAKREGGFELYAHVHEHRVRPVQEVGCLEDDEAGYDGIGRDDSGDDVVRHFCACVNGT